MTSKHTPGPWDLSALADGTEITVIGPSEDIIADLTLNLRAESDATLIAAAPDMLAALRMAEGELLAARGAAGMALDKARLDPAVRAIHSAIAKAEGN